MILLLLASLLLQGGAIEKCPEGITNVKHDTLPNYFWHCSGPGEKPTLEHCGEDVYVQALGECLSANSSTVQIMKREASGEKFKPILQVESSGEIVAIGALYNSRTHQMYTAGNLFKTETLKNGVSDTECQSSKFEVMQDRGLLSRAYLLNIEASIMLDYLDGLIHVAGSAKYLRDEVSNSDVARVTMSLRSTNRCKTIAITQLPNSKMCALVGGSSGPTHVVTSLITGVRSYFLYERQTSSTKEVSEMGGSLKVAIKTVPSFSVEGSATVNVKGESKKAMEKTNIKFYGDTILTNYPSKYEETHKSLEEILSNAKTAQSAIRYQLTPIEYFCDKQAKLIADLNKQIIETASKVYEELQSSMNEIKALLLKPPAMRFGSLKAQLLNLQVEVAALDTDIRRKISQDMPLIRTGEKKESDLVKIINEYRESPFSKDKMQALLFYLTRQMNTLTQITEKANKDNRIVVSYTGSANDNSCIFSSTYSFVFTLHVLPKDGIVTKYKTDGVVPQKDWFDDVERVSYVGGLLHDFVQFAELNNEGGQCFLIRMDNKKAENPESDIPDAEVGLFTNGKITMNIKDLVSPPPTPICHFSGYDFIQVETEVSTNPVVKGCTVEARRITKDEKDPKKEIKEEHSTVNGNDAVVMVNGLTRNLEYEIRTYYTMEGKLGKMAPSRWIKCKTAPTSTPIQVQIIHVTETSISVTWQPPQKPADAKNGIKYIVSAVDESGAKAGEEIVETQDTILQNLKPGSKYTIEVKADKDGALSEVGKAELATLPLALQTITAEAIAATSVDLAILQEKVNSPVNGKKEDVVLEYSKMDSSGSTIVPGSTVTRVILITDPSSTLQYKLTSLFPGSKYTVRCKIRLSVGDRILETKFSDGFIITTPPDGSDTASIQAQLNTLVQNRDNKISELKGDTDAIRNELKDFHTKVQGLIKKIEAAEARVQEALQKTEPIIAAGALQSCYHPGVKFYSGSTDYVSSANIKDCIKKCREKGNSCEAVFFVHQRGSCQRLPRRMGEKKYIMVKSMATSVNRVCLDVADAPKSKWDSCLKTNIKYSGSPTLLASDMNLEECVMACANTENCAGVSYNKQNKSCNYATSSINEVADVNFNSISLGCLGG